MIFFFKYNFVYMKIFKSKWKIKKIERVCNVDL